MRRGRSDFAFGLLAVLIVALVLQLAAPRLLDAQGSARLRFPSGTQTLPGIAFASSVATGFRLSAANTITAQMDAFYFRSGGSNFLNLTTVQDTSSATMNLANNTGLTFNTAARGIFWATGTAFASLGTPAVGTVYYCTDCTIATAPCTGAGTGALAIRVNSGTPAWRCQ